jgi:nucleoside-diphosphate-sugar epimerase
MVKKIFIPGGGGFLGSHFCERQPANVDEVLCVGNFFKGSNANVVYLLGNPRLELIRHDSSEVYGDPQIHPQPESYWGAVNSIGVRSCNDWGKRCAETLFFDYWEQHAVRINAARKLNTYSSRMHPDHLMNATERCTITELRAS